MKNKCFNGLYVVKFKDLPKINPKKTEKQFYANIY